MADESDSKSSMGCLVVALIVLILLNWHQVQGWACQKLSYCANAVADSEDLQDEVDRLRTQNNDLQQKVDDLQRQLDER